MAWNYVKYLCNFCILNPYIHMYRSLISTDSPDVIRFRPQRIKHSVLEEAPRSHFFIDRLPSTRVSHGSLHPWGDPMVTTFRQILLACVEEREKGREGGREKERESKARPLSDRISLAGPIGKVGQVLSYCPYLRSQERIVIGCPIGWFPRGTAGQLWAYYFW